MKRIALGLLVVVAIGFAATPAEGHGNGHGYHSQGWHGGHHSGYGPRHGPGPGCYPPPRVHYRPVPVAIAPVYPVYPAYPPPARQGFSYFSPGFSFSFSR